MAAMNNDNRADYIGIRHFSPDTIRMLRACLDMDVGVDKLRKSIKKQKSEAHIIQATLNALDYMVSNPEAGRVRWIEGDSYTWAAE